MEDEKTPKKGEESPEVADNATSDSSEPQVSYQQTVDDPYGYANDPYAMEPSSNPVDSSSVPAAQDPPPPPPPDPPAEDEDEDDDGMLRMSFMDHLEELRNRLIRIVAGVGVAFLFSLIFANDLWALISAPAADALSNLGFEPTLAQITPMDAFSTIWVKVPLLASVFLASPWILYQVWSFIAPGLYKNERRWAGPFVIVSAGLFITGGLFAYFVAFRFGLTFLLGIGKDINIRPVVSLVEYFDLFVNVTLGIGILFELPVLIFFLILLRITTPGFLISHSRYAILIITVLAAIVTPTPDVVNLTIFAVPMILLYFVGVFAGWLLVLNREGRQGVLKSVLFSLAAVLIVLGISLALAVFQFGYHFTSKWPFLVR